MKPVYESVQSTEKSLNNKLDRMIASIFTQVLSLEWISIQAIENKTTEKLLFDKIFDWISKSSIYKELDDFYTLMNRDCIKCNYNTKVTIEIHINTYLEHLKNKNIKKQLHKWQIFNFKRLTILLGRLKGVFVNS